MKYLTLTGRVLYSFIFLMGGAGHFSAKTIGFAATQGVPFAFVLVPISGVLALAGGLSIALGYKTKLGAWLIVLFLVPVTFALHNFWAAPDEMMKQMQMAMFFKNMALLGGAFFFANMGAGPLSVDNREHSAVQHNVLQVN